MVITKLRVYDIYSFSVEDKYKKTYKFHLL